MASTNDLSRINTNPPLLQSILYKQSRNDPQKWAKKTVTFDGLHLTCNDPDDSAKSASPSQRISSFLSKSLGSLLSLDKSTTSSKSSSTDSMSRSQKIKSSVASLTTTLAQAEFKREINSSVKIVKNPATDVLFTFTLQFPDGHLTMGAKNRNVVNEWITFLNRTVHGRHATQQSRKVPIDNESPSIRNLSSIPNHGHAKPEQTKDYAHSDAEHAPRRRNRLLRNMNAKTRKLDARIQELQSELDQMSIHPPNETTSLHKYITDIANTIKQYESNHAQLSPRQWYEIKTSKASLYNITKLALKMTRHSTPQNHDIHELTVKKLNTKMNGLNAHLEALKQSDPTTDHFL